jgi:uncharacterized protein DUF4406
MKLYLAYKMRDEPMFNFPWSHEVTAALRAQGHEVFNPAEFDEAGGFDPATSTAAPLSSYLEHDLAEVCKADGIALGRNWRLSHGACIEGFVAASLGKRCFEVMEHRGTNRDPDALHVALIDRHPSVVMGAAIQRLLPLAAAA